MSGGVEIVRARTVEDCAAMRSLVEAHIEYERSTTVLTADWEASFAQLVATGRVALFSAVLGAQPVGYATVTTDVATWTAKPFAYLDCLFIDPAHRGAGLGRQLVQAAADYARVGGVIELQWQTPSWNTSAVRFYERLGALVQSKSRFTLDLTQSSASPFGSL